MWYHSLSLEICLKSNLVENFVVNDHTDILEDLIYGSNPFLLSECLNHTTPPADTPENNVDYMKYEICQAKGSLDNYPYCLQGEYPKGGGTCDSTYGTGSTDECCKCATGKRLSEVELKTTEGITSAQCSVDIACGAGKYLQGHDFSRFQFYYIFFYCLLIPIHPHR